MKLVIGKNGQRRVPVVKKEVQVAPNYWISREVDLNGVYGQGNQTEFSFNGATIIGNSALSSAFSNNHTIQTITGLNNIKVIRSGGMNSVFFYSSVNVNGADFSNIENVGSYGLHQAFSHDGNVTGNVNFSKLTVAEGNSFEDCFNSCTHITGADFGLLECAGINSFKGAFAGCSGLLSFDFSKLKTADNYALVECFYGCNLLTTASFPKLETINVAGMQRCFFGASGTTTASFPKLKTVNTTGLEKCFQACPITSISMPWLEELLGTSTASSNMNLCFSGALVTSVVFPMLRIMKGGNAMVSCFDNCQNLTSLSFPSLRTDSFGTKNTQFNNMLFGVTGCTVHFPSNIQSVIGSWASVTGGFGGIDTTVLFDLPATVTLTGANSVNYQRNPNYDTGTALAWYNETDGYEVPFYTSGTSDPTIGTTIYSDSGCTTSVTTVASIA